MALAVVWAYVCGTVVFMAFLVGFGPEEREDYPDIKKICKCLKKTEKHTEKKTESPKEENPVYKLVARGKYQRRMIAAKGGQFSRLKG